MKLYFITGGVLYGGKVYEIDTDRRTWGMTDTQSCKKSEHAIKINKPFMKLDRLDSQFLVSELYFNGWRYDENFDNVIDCDREKAAEKQRIEKK